MVKLSPRIVYKPLNKLRPILEAERESLGNTKLFEVKRQVFEFT
jgi:hypothetical protein